MLYVNPLEVSHGARAEAALKGAGREKTALRELEHYFLKTLLTEMRSSEQKGALFEETPGGRFYQDMFNDKLAGLMADSGQVGIAKQIEAQLRIAEEGKKSADIVDAYPEGIAVNPGETEGMAVRKSESGIPLRDLGRSSETVFMPIRNAGDVESAGDVS